MATLRSSPRMVRLVEAPAEWLNGGEGHLVITEKGIETRYYFRALATQLPGRAFHIRKVYSFNTRLGKGEVHTEEYDCRVHTPADSNCECLGFLRWGHCRHVEVFAALIAKGKL